ncbi:hypothetical protein E5Q_02561, partial [Mixia osmundae IAM 14324]
LTVMVHPDMIDAFASFKFNSPPSTSSSHALISLQESPSSPTSAGQAETGSDPVRPRKAERQPRVAQACMACSSLKVKCDGKLPCERCLNSFRSEPCAYGIPRKKGPPRRIKLNTIRHAMDASMGMHDTSEGALASASPDGAPFDDTVTASYFGSTSMLVETLLGPRRKSITTDDDASGPPVMIPQPQWRQNEAFRPTPPVRLIPLPPGFWRAMLSKFSVTAHLICPIFDRGFFDRASTDSSFITPEVLAAIGARTLVMLDSASIEKILAAHGHDGQIDSSSLESHFEEVALAHVQNFGGGASLSKLQAAIIMCQHAIARGRSSQGYQLIASAVAMALELGLNQRCSLRGDPLVEVKRRTFWQIFVVDKVIAAYLGRPALLHRSDVDQALPREDCVDEVEDRVDASYGWSSSFLLGRRLYVRSTYNALIRLFCIIDDILVMIYSPAARARLFVPAFRRDSIATLHDALEKWATGLPAHMLAVGPNGETMIHLPHVNLCFLWYHLSRILLYRMFVPVPDPGLDDPLRICDDAACAISAIVRNMLRSSATIQSSMVTYATFCAGAVHASHFNDGSAQHRMLYQESLDCLAIFAQEWAPAVSQWQFLSQMASHPPPRSPYPHSRDHTPPSEGVWQCGDAQEYLASGNDAGLFSNWPFGPDGHPH